MLHGNGINIHSRETSDARVRLDGREVWDGWVMLDGCLMVNRSGWEIKHGRLLIVKHTNHLDIVPHPNIVEVDCTSGYLQKIL